MQTQFIEYRAGETILEGYLAYPERKESCPLVMIAHDWSGRNEFAQKQAEKLAAAGYAGFALDVYGKGLLGKTTEEKSQLMQPLLNDRALLRQRMLAAFHTARALPAIDVQRIAAMGFCFGGLCVLDLARSGAAVRGVVSMHGFFNAPPPSLPNETIHAKILAFHGAEDPMVPLTQITEFRAEMQQAKVDWQIHIFSNTVHGFTNPLANDPKLGTVYNPLAAERSWLVTQQFLEEIFQ